MKFSIVITTYNRLSLLRRAIDTALAQTIPCEVIVADDCSTDGTQEYVENRRQSLLAIGDERLIYHRNAENKGHSATVNAGVEIATGDWIKPLDDDDYLALNCIEEMSNAIAMRPEAVICSVQAAQVDENEVELFKTRQIGPGKAFYIPQEDIHYGMLLELVPFGTPVQVAFCRDAFMKTGGWDSSLDANFDDIDSWIKIAQFGEAIFINECLAYRTIWSGAYNQKFSLEKRLETNILVKQKIYALVSEKYRVNLPDLKDIEAYLKLHWSLVALKQGKIFSAATMGLLSFFLPAAWILLLGKSNLSQEAQKHLPKKYLNTETLAQENSKTIDKFYHFNPYQPDTLHTYLKLRWGITALQHGQFFNSSKAALSAILSPVAWKLLIRAIFPWLYRQENLSQQQIDGNAVVMEKIYNLVSEKHHPVLPNKELQTYLKLRWLLLAVRQKSFLRAIKIAVPTALSPVAWKLLARVSRFQKQNKQEALIRRLVLIDG
ncbi:MAG: glycosyltransferase [Kastovskya adunca ATA6-11-RM4]|jgi:glycosyltransferase involved in cell wall biosynthesis|nr:glycosyltransferase [Kastovskya adunca ATA6-11-RM4]